MVISFIVIIILVLFCLWALFAFYKLAVLAIVNLTISGLIILRMTYDLKKNIAYYLVALALSVALLPLLTNISLNLSRLAVMKAVQFLTLIFLIAQIIISISKHTKNHHP